VRNLAMISSKPKMSREGVMVHRRLRDDPAWYAARFAFIPAKRAE
jgi:hypothetical protein